MPIEIRELHIKAVVDDSERIRDDKAVKNELSDEQIDEIVTICIEKILEIIKDKNER